MVISKVASTGNAMEEGDHTSPLACSQRQIDTSQCISGSMNCIHCYLNKGNTMPANRRCNAAQQMTLVIDGKFCLNETVTLSSTLYCLHFDFYSWGPALYNAAKCLQWPQVF